MHSLSFSETHLVAKDSLKLNNTIKTCLIRIRIGKLYTFPFKDTFLDTALNPLDTLSRQN